MSRPSTLSTLFTLALAIACAGYYFGAGLAICIGYHRVLSHRSAVPVEGLERLFVTLGLPAGTPIQWAGNHRFHHAHADQPDDPPFAARRLLARAQRAGTSAARTPLSCVLYALAGPLRILFDGVHRPRSNQQHVHLAPDVAADPWYRWVSRPGPYLALAIAHVVLFFGGAFWLFGWAGVAAAVADAGGDLQPGRRHRQRRAHRRRACPTADLTWRATTGSSASSAWATAGTRTTTASRGAPATVWNPGSGTSSWRVITSLAQLGLARNVRVPSAEQIHGRAPARRRRSMSTPPEPAPTTGPAPPPGAATGDDFVAELGTIPHDRRDPDQWWALYTDRSLPLDPQVKAALVLDARSFSRRVLLPLLRPLARGLLILVGLFRTLVPRALTSSSLLHRLIYFGLRHFVSPQANFLILRHFHLGSNVVGFLAANSGTRVSTLPLRPLEPADVKDHLFLQHDLNLYNFVISLNAALAAEDRGLSPPARIDFDAHRRGAHPVPAVSARPVQLPRLDLGDRALHAALSPAAGAA